MNKTRKNTIENLDIYVGHRLRQRREKINLKLTDLGKMVGLSHQQIFKYEKGEVRIPASMLYNLAKSLAVPVNFFYEGYQPHKEHNNDHLQNKIINLENNKPLNVLIIEDDPADEILTRNALKNHDHEINVHSEHDGNAALEFLKNKRNINTFPKPDLIFLDLNIPQKDGFTVLKNIKGDSTLKDIPVIILTNSVNVQELKQIYNNNASGFINKDFDIDGFYKKISIAIDYWTLSSILPSVNDQPKYL